MFVLPTSMASSSAPSFDMAASICHRPAGRTACRAHGRASGRVTMAPHVGLAAAPPLAGDAGLLRRVRGRRVRGALAARLLRHRRGSSAQRGSVGPVRAAVRLRRRDDAERARQPVAGDRRRARHRHHRRLDRRAAGGDPLHVARRRHVLPRPHQPGRDGLLRRRLRRGAVGQLHGAQGLRPAGDDHRRRSSWRRAACWCWCRTSPTCSTSSTRRRSSRASAPRRWSARRRPSRRGRGRRRPPPTRQAQAVERPRAPGRHRGQRARAEGQGDRDRRVGGAAPAAGRVPDAQGRARRRLVRDRRGAARRSGLRRAGRRFARRPREPAHLAGVEGPAPDPRGVRRGADDDARDGARRRHRHALRGRGGAGGVATARCWC